MKANKIMPDTSKLLRSLILVSALIMSGCSTVNFVRSDLQEEQHQPDTKEPNHEWHHHGPFSFFELSTPVDLDERCEGHDWQRVSTSQTFTNGLVTHTLSALTVIPLYSSRTVSYVCARPVEPDESNNGEQ